MDNFDKKVQETLKQVAEGVNLTAGGAANL